MQSEPPFEKVIHCASPFHFNVTDVKKDLYVFFISSDPSGSSNFPFRPTVSAICRLMHIVHCLSSMNQLLNLALPPQARSCHHWHDWALESNQKERTDCQTCGYNQQFCSYHRCRQRNQPWSYVGHTPQPRGIKSEEADRAFSIMPHSNLHIAIRRRTGTQSPKRKQHRILRTVIVLARRSPRKPHGVSSRRKSLILILLP